LILNATYICTSHHHHTTTTPHHHREKKRGKGHDLLNVFVICWKETRLRRRRRLREQQPKNLDITSKNKKGSKQASISIEWRIQVAAGVS
jgi:hypothetical protein